ncbi:Msa family membrane protein [Staphylococcus simiae]|uniref:Msa family membrane protein n=3 Tax=Staphylococcus simiae TaxID=308354 RepID=UPI001A95E46A|nr:Msa family membrane protein [Staphylococcus simiae]MBO1197811.1 Msa family membrane protein [Staphylococcus simiae]MBO1200528.1 Msa family membrane protein [Staphylococcus simiae]MBO1202800.1 Msa family membrane protein [Staphylococcus simiae]QSY54903.1 Msa family membrane protein [Staphylococcus simiae]
MIYILISLVLNLIFYGILSVVGLKLNVLLIFIFILTIPILIAAYFYFKTTNNKLYIFTNIMFLDLYYYMFNLHLIDTPQYHKHFNDTLNHLKDDNITLSQYNFNFNDVVFLTIYMIIIFIILSYYKKHKIKK